MQNRVIKEWKALVLCSINGFSLNLCVFPNIPLRVPSSQLVNPPPQKQKKMLFLDCKSEAEKRLKKLHFHANIVFMNGMK